jgi:hypothetical protein
METSKNLLRALDMVTTPKEPRPERLGAVSVAHAQQMRTIFDDPNVIGVGISEKVTGKRRTGELSLCFYVEKKVSERKLSAAKLIPPVVAVPDGHAVFTDVKQIGKLLPQANIRKSPIKSGYSVGHRSITAGTVGAIALCRRVGWQRLQSDRPSNEGAQVQICQPLMCHGFREAGQ